MALEYVDTRISSVLEYGAETVEDTVGGVLAKQHLRNGPAGYKGAKSETQQHYDDTVVRAMANKEKFRSQDSEDQPIALRGLPNHLLFGHEGDYTAQTRYRTTAEDANACHAKYARTSRDKLMRKKRSQTKWQPLRTISRPKIVGQHAK